MQPLLALISMFAGLILGALLVRWLGRSGHDAELRAAALEGERRGELERARMQALVESARTQLRGAEERDRDRRSRVAELESATVTREREVAALRAELTRLRTEEAIFATRLEEVQRIGTQVRESFQALSGDVLRASSEQFLQLARAELEKLQVATRTDLQARENSIAAILQPIRDGLARYDRKIEQIERERTDSSARLTERLAQVVTASETLRAETATLARALRSANVRGTWGEVQLRRVCELAGMLDRCDFRTQESVSGENGALRPDLVVNLPAGRTVIVDAKAPLSAYLEAASCEHDARRDELLRQHAAQVRRHVDALSRKAYWAQFSDAPEFVVLFLPSEAIFSAALEHDPALIEHGVAQRVLIATPTTLIALLRAVAYGWSQERMARSAHEISALGRALYDRLCTMTSHLESVGTNLKGTVSAYNQLVGSMERRVLVSARRFRDLGTVDRGELTSPEPLELLPRGLTPERDVDRRQPGTDGDELVRLAERHAP